MKISKRTLIITSLVTLVPMLVGICLWDQLPDVMATHFGFDNEPNGWTSKAFTVFGIPSVLVLLQLVAVYTTSKDPRKVFHNNTLMNIVVWIIPVIAVVVLGATYMYNMEMAIEGLLTNIGTSDGKLSEEESNAIKYLTTTYNKENT